jgi:hypothetical protein
MFDAARDLVFTNSADGNSITSGGYRISKIFGGMKRKQKGGKKKNIKEHEDYNEEMENFYKEESGIPMGLLFVVPKFHVEHQHQAHLDQALKKESDFHMNDNDRIAGIGDLELIMPKPQSQSSQFIIIGDDNSCELKEDAREINSQEVDADLFRILLENALTDPMISNENTVSSRKNTRKRTINFANNSNSNNSINLKNLKVDKIYVRRKTRRNNN